MRLGQYQFTPSLLITVLYLLVGSAMLALGVWQLERAGQKIAMQQSAASAAAAAPVDIGQIDSSSAQSQYTRVSLRGRFEPARQFLWDNRIANGQAGFEVITPLRLLPGDQLVLINRGWVRLGPSRQTLPDISLDLVDEVQFTGVFTQPSIGFSGGDAVNLRAGGWPRILQHLDYQQIAAVLQEPVLSGLVQVLRTDSSIAGLGGTALYPDNWQPVAHGPERHYGYAFQWFAMFAALSGLYLFLNTSKTVASNS